METEWNEKENTYTSLCRSVEVLTSNIEKVEKEKDYIEGDNRFSDDFQCLQEMYEDKEMKQAILIEELREEQRNLKANKEARLEQVRIRTCLVFKVLWKNILILLSIFAEGNIWTNYCYSKVEARTR